MIKKIKVNGTKKDISLLSLRNKNFQSPNRYFHACHSRFQNASASETKPVKENKVLLASKFCAIGFAGAAGGTLSGLGGGVIMVPLLRRFANRNLNQLEATSSSLFGVFLNSIVAGISFYMLGVNIDLQAAAAIGGSATLSSIFGARFSTYFRSSTLQLMFGVMAFCLSLFFPIYSYLKAKNKVHSMADNVVDGEIQERQQQKVLLIHVCSGLFVGMLSGLLGIGGAVFYVPLLSVTAIGLSQVQIAGTALLCTLLPSFFGGLTHYLKGNLRVGPSTMVALGCVIGGIVGSHLAVLADEKLLKQIFAAFVFVISIRTLRQGWKLRISGM